MKIKVKATFETEFDIDISYYPIGATKEDIEKIELENIKNEPHFILENMISEEYSIKVEGYKDIHNEFI